MHLFSCKKKEKISIQVFIILYFIAFPFLLILSSPLPILQCNFFCASEVILFSLSVATVSGSWFLTILNFSHLLLFVVWSRIITRAILISKKFSRKCSYPETHHHSLHHLFVKGNIFVIISVAYIWCSPYWISFFSSCELSHCRCVECEIFLGFCN